MILLKYITLSLVLCRSKAIIFWSLSKKPHGPVSGGPSFKVRRDLQLVVSRRYTTATIPTIAVGNSHSCFCFPLCFCRLIFSLEASKQRIFRNSKSQVCLHCLYVSLHICVGKDPKAKSDFLPTHNPKIRPIALHAHI